MSTVKMVIFKNKSITINLSIDSRKRKKNMSYRELLQKQIREIEQKIISSQGEKLELEQKLQQLRLAEFEEELREDGSSPQLLKG